MKVLFVSVEVAPFAKVGGLADVAGALPKALKALGHDVRVVMPLYQMIEDDPRWELESRIENLPVQIGRHWSKSAHYKELEHDGVRIGFIGTDEWYPHSVSSETLYQPGGMQHLFFCSAVLQIMEKLDWIPDVVHCNDWHTGFLPVLIREKASPIWDSTATVFTIHNFAYQGEFGPEVLDAMDLPRSLYNSDQVEAWGRVNFLKAGCVFADRVNTVSKTYANEIQTHEYGCALDGLMRHLAAEGTLSGILNGIDQEVWDPATDPALPAHYTSTDTSNKAICRAELYKELDMAPMAGAPLLGVVSRISSQKGIHLILEAAQSMFMLPCQVVIQGLGDPVMAESFRALEEKHPRQFRYVPRFDADLAQRVYAGCDGFLMPSAFEPCGLGQMIAMRYGTVPIVRKTGGLGDTVSEDRNGFVFDRLAPMDFLAAVVRAYDAFQDSARWPELMRAGMSGDYSWAQSAKEYAKLYRSAISARRKAVAQTA